MLLVGPDPSLDMRFLPCKCLNESQAPGKTSAVLTFAASPFVTPPHVGPCSSAHQAYTASLQTLADRMAEGLDIAFGCVATRVAWDDAGVQVTCENGRTFTADALIVTVSLGVLK